MALGNDGGRIVRAVVLSGRGASGSGFSPGGEITRAPRTGARSSDTATETTSNLGGGLRYMSMSAMMMGVDAVMMAAIPKSTLCHFEDNLQTIFARYLTDG